MVALMLHLLLGMRAALADPLALRMAPPDGTPRAAVAVGWPESSAAWWSAGGWGVAAGVRLPSGAVEVAAGRRIRTEAARTTGAARGWEAGGAGGLQLLPLYAPPALAVTATPYARRWRAVGTSELALGVSVPGAIRVTQGAEVRLPLLLETAGGRPLGPTWVGVQLGGGVILSPGQGGWALGGQAGLVVQPRAR